MKKYTVIDAETELSVQSFESKKEAEKLAKEMTQYHHRKFVVRED